MEPREGQRLRITIEGTVMVATSNHAACTHIRDDSGHNHWVFLSDYSSANVETINPAHWPPQVGDIWEVDDEEYFVRTYGIRRAQGLIIQAFTPSGGPGQYYGPASHDDFKDRNPRLVRRREAA